MESVEDGLKRNSRQRAQLIERVIVYHMRLRVLVCTVQGANHVHVRAEISKFDCMLVPVPLTLWRQQFKSKMPTQARRATPGCCEQPPTPNFVSTRASDLTSTSTIWARDGGISRIICQRETLDTMTTGRCIPVHTHRNHTRGPAHIGGMAQDVAASPHELEEGGGLRTGGVD